MPVYVYKGLETGEYYEFEQGYHDEPYTQHPETGEPIKRIIVPRRSSSKGPGGTSRTTPPQTARANRRGRTPRINPTPAASAKAP